MSGFGSGEQLISGPVRLASRNPGKVREVRAIMAEVGIDVLPAPEDWIAPEETGATYLENAMLKARSLMAHTGEPALADDSGIEVDVLDGGPGPRSARFAGEAATDQQNLEKLIRIVRTTPPHERGARYRCVAVLSVPNGQEQHAEGIFEGSLIADPRGANGFGYDPVFIPVGETRTAAELAPSQKDAMSHRGKAFRALAGAVRALVEAPAASVFDRPHVPVLDAAPNEGKSIEIDVNGETWLRLPVRTHTVTEIDDAAEVVERYCRGMLREGDIVIMSERVVAITQGRAYPIANIVPGRLAKFLQRFVTRTPVGIGLGSPWTMELAIREVGKTRILAAAAAAAVTKPFGVKGVFYRVAGAQARAIDGPCDNTLPPFNEYATLGPAKPDESAARIAARVQAAVVIIDANDLGVNVLGRSPSAPSEAFCEAVFRDNPLGQSSQRTPIAIVRRA